MQDVPIIAPIALTNTFTPKLRQSCQFSWNKTFQYVKEFPSDALQDKSLEDRLYVSTKNI